MSRFGEIEEVPPKFDEEGNPIIIEEGSKMGASNAPTLEDLTRKLVKITVESKKLRAKVRGNKTKGSSSSSKEEDSLFEEEVSKKGKKGRRNLDKSFYNSMFLIIITNIALPLILSYMLAKLPILMELAIINGSIV
jgi:hypothetical protein